MEKRGGLYFLEGTDGVGKSTQVDMLADRFRAEGYSQVYIFNEPAGVDFANQIRTALKDGSVEHHPIADAYGFTAARSATWHLKTKTLLEHGGIGIGARKEISTKIYNGIAETKHATLDDDFIDEITLRATGERYMNPDWIGVLDLEDEAERARRIANRGSLETLDTFESRDSSYQQRVIHAYRRYAHTHGIPLIDGLRSPEVIHEDIWNRIAATGLPEIV